MEVPGDRKEHDGMDQVVMSGRLPIGELCVLLERGFEAVRPESSKRNGKKSKDGGEAEGSRGVHVG